MKKKIVYIHGGLYAPNGMSSIISQKVNYLADHTDFDIHMVLTERPEAPRYYKLSERVSTVNLDINFDELDTMPLLKKAWYYWWKQRRYKKLLTAYLMEQRPDIVVSITRREINFLTKIKDGSKKIAEIHFARSFYRQLNKRFLPACVNRYISKLWMNSLSKNLRNVDRFVVLTNEDSRNWPELNNVIVIPNFISFFPEKKSDATAKQVIAVGRYTYQKGFDLLIDAWTQVAKRHPDWTLRIYGAGEPDAYRRLVSEKGLEGTVCCEEATNDVYSKYNESSLFVLSSRYEGFGMVLIEAMSAGLPCVAFTCPCGPKDIITNHEDGLLVENGNIDKLADAICYLIEHPEERQQMGRKAVASSQRYREKSIMQYWIELFENL